MVRHKGRRYGFMPYAAACYFREMVVGAPETVRGEFQENGCGRPETVRGKFPDCDCYGHAETMNIRTGTGAASYTG